MFYLCTEERKQHKAQLEALPTDAARESFEAEKAAALDAWRNVKRQKDEWKEKFDKREKPLNDRLAKQRQDHKDRLIHEMHRRISELGWERELTHDSKKQTLWDIPAWELIGEPLSETVWLSLLPSLLKRLKLLRVDRVNREASQRLSAALSVLDDLRKEFSVKHLIVPENGDLFRMEPIQDAIFSVFRRSKHLAPDMAWEKEEIRTAARKVMEQHLEGLTDEWVVDKKREIYALVPKPAPAVSKKEHGPEEQAPSRATIDVTLNLATTLFHIPNLDITESPYSPLTPTQLLAAQFIAARIACAPPRGEKNPLNLAKIGRAHV